MVQRREHHEVASALLWLGLWPGLTGVYGRRVRHFRVSPTSSSRRSPRAFTELVERLDLTTVHRVAATLVRSTERDVMYHRKRAWAEASDGLRVDHEDEPPATLDEDDFIASWFDKASLKRWAETQHGSALGLTPGLSFDEDVAVLRAWLEPWSAKTRSCSSPCWSWTSRVARSASAWGSPPTAGASASSAPWLA
jgi:hypothetical protein